MLELPVTPRPYRRPPSRTWWLRNIRYTLFMLREASSIFLALFALLYLVQVALLLAGPGPYTRYLALLTAPGWIALHFLILLFALVHTVSWFQLMPSVTPVRLGRRQLPPRAAWAGALVLWTAASVGVAFVIVRG